MLQLVTLSLLWFGAVGCGVIGGVYFAFSTFIMAALGTMERASGIAAMQAINDVILRSLFMPLFFGTTIAGVILAIIAVLQWSGPQAPLIFAGAVIFVAGMFIVTVVFNVPLNNALVASPAASAEASAVWTEYLKTWTFWNHVRTVTSIAASVLFVMALIRG